MRDYGLGYAITCVCVCVCVRVCVRVRVRVRVRVGKLWVCFCWILCHVAPPAALVGSVGFFYCVRVTLFICLFCEWYLALFGGGFLQGVGIGADALLIALRGIDRGECLLGMGVRVGRAGGEREEEDVGEALGWAPNLGWEDYILAMVATFAIFPS